MQMIQSSHIHHFTHLCSIVTSDLPFVIGLPQPIDELLLVLLFSKNELLFASSAAGAEFRFPGPIHDMRLP